MLCIYIHRIYMCKIYTAHVYIYMGQSHTDLSNGILSSGSSNRRPGTVASAIGRLWHVERKGFETWKMGYYQWDYHHVFHINVPKKCGASHIFRQTSENYQLLKWHWKNHWMLTYIWCQHANKSRLAIMRIRVSLLNIQVMSTLD